MRRYQYEKTSPMGVVEMRAKGEAGWKLVAVAQEPAAGGYAVTTYYWRRRLPRNRSKV